MTVAGHQVDAGHKAGSELLVDHQFFSLSFFFFKHHIFVSVALVWKRKVIVILTLPRHLRISGFLLYLLNNLSVHENLPFNFYTESLFSESFLSPVHSDPPALIPCHIIT